MGHQNKIMLQHGWILFYNMQRFKVHPTLDLKKKKRVTFACSPKHHTNAVIQYMIVLLQPKVTFKRDVEFKNDNSNTKKTH